METIIRQIYEQARTLGACPLFTGRERTLEDIIRLFTTPQGMEFCMGKHFPNIATFRLFKPYGVEKHGIYIDAGRVVLRNPTRAIFIGHTNAVVSCDTLAKHEIYLLQGATAVVNASSWAVACVRAESGCSIVKNVSDNAVIL